MHISSGRRIDHRDRRFYLNISVLHSDTVHIGSPCQGQESVPDGNRQGSWSKYYYSLVNVDKGLLLLGHRYHPPHPHRVKAYSPHLPDAYNNRSTELGSSRTRKLGPGKRVSKRKNRKIFHLSLQRYLTLTPNFSPCVTTNTSPHRVKHKGNGFLPL